MMMMMMMMMMSSLHCRACVRYSGPIHCHTREHYSSSWLGVDHISQFVAKKLRHYYFRRRHCYSNDDYD